MKSVSLVALPALLLSLNLHAASGSSLKTEGNCTGNLNDGTPVSFTYYSDFNGCKNTSKSAISFHSGIDGLLTGSRSIKGSKDYYNFPRHDLTFANSTGNTSGTLGYRDENNQRHVIKVQCEVRDYEYSEC